MSENRLKGLAKGILVVTALVAAASSYQGQSKGSRSIQQQLMQLQRAEDDAEKKKDIAALNSLLSDDFLFTAPNGVISDKKKLIEDVKNGGPASDETISYDDVRAHVYGTTAVVNYLLIVKGGDKDRNDFTNHYRNTVVWVKQQGHWRMAAIHVSRIRQ